MMDDFKMCHQLVFSIQAYAKERYGIRVNCICPAVVDTPLMTEGGMKCLAQKTLATEEQLTHAIATQEMLP